MNGWGEGMAKFRKRPATVDAEAYRPGMEDGFAPLGEAVFADASLAAQWAKLKRRSVPFLESPERVRRYVAPGDVIVTDADGQRRPWNPDAFAAMYEPA